MYTQAHTYMGPNRRTPGLREFQKLYNQGGARILQVDDLTSMCNDSSRDKQDD